MTKTAASPPDNSPTPSAPPEPPWWHRWLLPIGLALSLILFLGDPRPEDEPLHLPYSEFIERIDAGEVQTAEIESSGFTTGTLDDGTEYTTHIPVELAGEGLLERLESHGVEVISSVSEPSLGEMLWSLFLSIAPLLLLAALWLYMARRAGRQLGGVFGMGRSGARVFDAERPKTTFDDVAGYASAKAEIMEIVDFLRNPERYRSAGAIAPRGVLMAGPPGTGKTLLARAVAGEADVPFFSVTGSSFVEMFVGVGAARVRDLFSEARKRAPSIIFIDEIDAIGQHRSANVVASNDEREQTLNQLLAEMDGFDPSDGVVVLAATNRPELLDPALLRPGRFDRQVTIPLPNQTERREILEVHCRGKRLASDVDLDVLSRGTPGFSGADLANLVNEAAIRAARDGRSELTAADFDDARDRIILGRRDGSNVLLPEEREAVAVHEAGHALVAAHCDHADPVHKVTILPAGQALGVTHQLPLHERHLYSEMHLHDLLAVQLGGRAAEKVVFGHVSTGAANDLANATQIATRMVREFGLSEELGPVAYPSASSFLGPAPIETGSRPYADETQHLIDAAVQRLVREAQDRAIEIVSRERDALDRIVARLLEEETIEGEVVYELAGRPVPAPHPQVLGP